jgi:DNA repair protein RadD
MTTYTLRPYQQAAVDAGVAYLTDPALKGRHGLIVQPTGAGKSLVIANIVARLPGPCVVLQPSKEILEQNAAKLASYGYHAAVFSASFGRREIGRITLATIGSVVRYAEAFRETPYVLIDECVPAGTLIGDTPVEQVAVGDLVPSWNAETGLIESRRVSSVFVRKATRLVRVSFASGRTLVCTPDHPVFTVECGYVPASAAAGLTTLAYNSKYEVAASGVPGLRQGVHRHRDAPQEHSQGAGLLLLNRLRGYSTDCEAPHDASAAVRRTSAIAGGAAALVAENAGPQPDGRRGDPPAHGCVATSHWAQADNSGRQWATATAPSASAADDVGRRMAGGVRGADGPTPFRVPALLQDRHREPAHYGRDRSRRPWPQQRRRTRARHAKGYVPAVDRVDAIQVLEPGGDGRFGGLCPGGRVYDLEVERNHNFFANGALIHNCHAAVNPKGGQYLDFLQVLDGARILGLTATPFRLASNSLGSELRFLTRTRPRIFRDVVHVTQIQDLVRDGYWAPLDYRGRTVVQREKLQLNSTGADYTDASVQRHFAEIGFVGALVDEVRALLTEGRQHILVFTRFVNESERLAQALPCVGVVTAETPPTVRAQVVREFRAGRLRVVTNVGCLALGFDFPALDAVVLGRPSISLSVFYQQVGRGVRPHPSKANAAVVDMVGLVSQFGKAEDLVVRPTGHNGEQWVVSSNGRALTNTYFAPRDGIDTATIAKAQRNRQYWARRRGGDRWPR